MRPIRFACSQLIAQSVPAICAAIADVARWREFKGYGLLPGIADATYEQRTDNMIGSRVRVRNTDGSGHVEEFYAWEPTQQVAMKFDRFTPPCATWRPISPRNGCLKRKPTPHWSPASSNYFPNTLSSARFCG